MRVSLGRSGGHRGVFSFAFVALAASGFASSACSSSGSSGGAGTGGTAGSSAGASSGGTAGGATAGAAGHGGGSTGASNGGSAGSGGAAALWSRTGATCTSLGEDCSQCGTDTVCYDNPPNACVPHGSGFRCSVGYCTADKPYCIDDYCLNLNDASCFCTADPGKTIAGCLISPADHLAATTKANACHAQDEPCGGTDTEACCAGTTCAHFGTDAPTCIKACTTKTDCTSGCCVTLTGSTVMICGPAANCQ